MNYYAISRACHTTKDRAGRSCDTLLLVLETTITTATRTSTTILLTTDKMVQLPTLRQCLLRHTVSLPTKRCLTQLPAPEGHLALTQAIQQPTTTRTDPLRVLVAIRTTQDKDRRSTTSAVRSRLHLRAVSHSDRYAKLTWTGFRAERESCLHAIDVAAFEWTASRILPHALVALGNMLAVIGEKFLAMS